MVRLSAGWESTQGSRRYLLPEVPQKALLGFFVRGAVARGFELAQEFLLPRGELGWCANHHPNVLIPTSIAAQIANPLASQHEHLARLSAWGNGQRPLAI